MDRTFKHRCLKTVSLIFLLLGNLEKVYCTDNLAIRGNVVTGETFQIICSSNPDSQGRAAYTFYRSSTRDAIGQTVGSIRFIPWDQYPCQTFYTIPYPFGCEDNGSKGYINITVPTDNVYNLTEHNKYWRCHTLSDPTAAHNNEILVSIIVPIKGISCISPPESPANTVTVVTEVPTTVQCQTTQGRPAANITWYLDNVPLSGGTTTTTPISGDIVITTGSLTLTVNMTADYKVLSCRATNYVNMEPIESTVKPVIRVKYAPSGPPVIVGYSNGSIYKIALRRPQSVTCQVPTAHPVPTLSWSCPSYTVTGTTLLPGYTDVVSSSITWTVTSTEPGQTCQCTSYQEVSGTVTTYTNIDVLYPPSYPTYTLDVSGVSTAVSGSIYVIQGETVYLTCNTVSNPPPATDHYRWTRSTAGPWTHRQQELAIPNIDRSSDDTYTCDVTNTMTTADGKSDTGRNSSQIAITVLYPPSTPTYKLDMSGISTDVSGSIDVIQGGTVHLTCNTVSNPPPATDQYRWTRFTGASWTHGQQELTMTHINVSDDAVYTCKVTNTMTPTVVETRTGTNQSVIAVNVLSQLTMITLKNGDDDLHTGQDIELQEGIQKQLTIEVEPAEGLTFVTIYCYLGETSYELSKGTRIFSFMTKSVDHGKSIYCKANNIGLDNYKFTQAVKLKVLGKPEPPSFLISRSPGTNSVSLFWLPGYHGDADQTFHIDFRRVNGSWVKGPDVFGGQIQGQLFNLTVSDLKADTRYEFRIAASSSVGSRDLFTYEAARTFSAIVIRTCSPSNNIGAAVGGSVGGLAIVVVISVFVVWYCRKTENNEGPDPNKSMNRERANTGSSQHDAVSAYYNIGSDIEDRQTSDGSSCYQDLTNRGPVVVPVYQTLDVVETKKKHVSESTCTYHNIIV